jgi:hypothetical protein
MLDKDFKILNKVVILTVKVIITLTVMPTCLWIIFHSSDSETKKWATATFAFFLGYWIK